MPQRPLDPGKDGQSWSGRSTNVLYTDWAKAAEKISLTSGNRTTPKVFALLCQEIQDNRRRLLWFRVWRSTALCATIPSLWKSTLFCYNLLLSANTGLSMLVAPRIPHSVLSHLKSSAGRNCLSLSLPWHTAKKLDDTIS